MGVYYRHKRERQLARSITMTRENIMSDLINYSAGSGISEEYNNEQKELFAEFDRYWQQVPCDPEGPNKEQNKELDNLLDEYASKILAIVEDYRFSEMEFYKQDTCIAEADYDDYTFYHDELTKIRKENDGIIIAWIVPDEDCGHVEYKVFNTWTDAGMWTRQN